LNPTDLYLSIQTKNWDKATELAKNDADSCATWVYRKEKNGKLRWRLLPLHAAIIFKAPENSIEALLVSFPDAAQCKDDQGMLPIHLAFRNGSDDIAVNLLLVAYPDSMNVKDRKGRVPLVLAQASNSPFKDSYIRALDHVSSYYAVAKAAVRRIDSSSQFGVHLEPNEAEISLQKHEMVIQTVKVSAETKEKELQNKISEVQVELSKTQETSQVLVDHVNSLEAQLSSRSDTERFLATKIANLDSTLKETNRNKELIEAKLNAEKEELEILNADLSKKKADLEDELNTTKSNLEEQTLMVIKLSKAKVENRSKLEQRCISLQREQLEQTANAAVLEAQLKKKIQNEHTLATQVSDLAAKLAEAAGAASTATASYVERIETLEEEKRTLNHSVEMLTEKLEHVAQVLDCMSTEQTRIVSFAARHEAVMAETAEQQQQIMADAARQEQILIDAAREREQIVYILTRQAEEIDKTTHDRERILEAVQTQNAKVAAASQEREELLATVGKQRANMDSLKAEIKELCSISSGNNIIEDTDEESIQDVALAEECLMRSAQDDLDSVVEGVEKLNVANIVAQIKAHSENMSENEKIVEEGTLNNTPSNKLAYCSQSPTEILPRVNEEPMSAHPLTFEHDSTENKIKESDFNELKTHEPIVLDSTFNQSILFPTMEVTKIIGSKSVQSSSEPMTLTSEPSVSEFESIDEILAEAEALAYSIPFMENGNNDIEVINE